MKITLICLTSGRSVAQTIILPYFYFIDKKKLKKFFTTRVDVTLAIGMNM